jgi:hypothetical protein
MELFTKKNMKYPVYENILNLMKFQNITIITPIISIEKLQTLHFTIIHGEKKVDKDLPLSKYIFIYIFSDNTSYYKSAAIIKIISDIPEISKSTRNYTIDCRIIIDKSAHKLLSNHISKVSDETPSSYIRYLLIDPHILYIDILQHNLVNYKYKIISDEKEKEELYTLLHLNKYNDKWNVNFPEISYNDPISIWCGLQINEILYYDGKYRICVAKKMPD